MVRTKATATVQIDDARVRVTRWDFPPGSETGHHVHGHDYVVVPVIGGRLAMEHDDGTTSEADLVVGRSYARPAGVSHNVVNDGQETVAFVEIELKP